MTLPLRTIARAATAAATIASALAYPFVPARVAIHFDTDGQPDRFSSPVSAALTLPAMMIALSAVNDRIGGWPGGRDREDIVSGVRARDKAIGLVNLTLLAVHVAILAHALGLRIDMRRVERGVYGLLLIGMGNVLPTLPRNGLVGIRTPWTLADPMVWERTHRLGGYLLTAAGLVSVASVPVDDPRMSRVPLVTALSAIGLSTVYSCVIYVRRPHSSR